MIRKIIEEYIKDSGFSYISRNEAFDKAYVGLELFEKPLIGYADVNDPLFDEFCTNPKILNNKFMHPLKWLPKANTVISVFFPFTDEVKKSNIMDLHDPSGQWLQARFEGQKHLNEITRYMLVRLMDEGYDSMAPALDPRYKGSFTEKRSKNMDYATNWSERHIAYVAGLGTFGLSGGLITDKGIAGRFLSLITQRKIKPTPRKYTEVLEFCSECGECIKRCPAYAISEQKGKQHVPCEHFLDDIRVTYSPRYGCGKCQVGVPCMSCMPTSGK